MAVFLTLLGLALLALVAIALLNRYYRKSSRELALVRTGFGGRCVVLDSACLVLPFLHHVESVSLRSHRLRVHKHERDALVTGDSLRVCIQVEFAMRVEASEEAVAKAASTLGANTIEAEELSELLQGSLNDAVQQVVACSSLLELHQDRHTLAERIGSLVKSTLVNYGLVLDSVAITELDQAPLDSFDQSNIFDATGLRKLSEELAEQRLQRVTNETEKDVGVRRAELEALKRKLELEQQQSDLEIMQHQRIAIARAKSEADIEQSRQASVRQQEHARLEREQQLQQLEIQKDQQLKESSAKAMASAEFAKIDSQIALAKKRAEESSARAEAELQRSGLIQAQEHILREKEVLAVQRGAEVESIRQQKRNALQETEARSRAEQKLASAEAEAEAKKLAAEALKSEEGARAEGVAAIAEAENKQSEALLAHKLELEKVRCLPDVAGRMAKPLEKIDSIRINHIGGLGGAASSGGASPLGDSLQQVMGLAVQLPALKKLGDEIGLDLDTQLGGRMADAAARIASTTQKNNKPEVAVPPQGHTHNDQESER